MATRQAWAGWAVVLAAALLAAPGCSSKREPAQASSQAEPPEEVILDLGGGVTMKLVLIRPGKFMMGSPDSEKGRVDNEGPQHEVTISKPFYMGVTEVTQAQYEAIMSANPSTFKGETNPVENVSCNDATAFCKKLAEKTRQAVRLPTEAEWEYACRAGSKNKFCFGDADEGLGDYAWYHANSGGMTHPVGQKKPNAWGLYDMHGNLWEWCSDWYAQNYAHAKAVDPQGPASGMFRVLRDGSWRCGPELCRSADRGGGLSPSGGDYGFRVTLRKPRARR
jgi:formylglycine-generating enzyme required for sulfatase activity